MNEIFTNLLNSGPLGWWFLVLSLYGIYGLILNRDPIGLLDKDPTTGGADSDFRIKWIMMYLFFILPLAFGVGAVVIRILERFF